MATETAITNITDHFKVQLATITGVNPPVLVIDPTTDTTTKMDWVGFVYDVNWKPGRYACNNHTYPLITITFRVGIAIGDSQRDQHNTQKFIAYARLIDWLDGWIIADTWSTIVGVDNVSSNEIRPGTSRISQQPLRSMVYIDIPFTIER